MSAHSGSLLWSLALALALSSSPAGAQPSTIIVLTDPDDVELKEAAVRLRGELESVGFSASIQKGVTPGRGEAETSARSANASAAITLSRTAERATVELWVADQVTGKSVVRVVSLEKLDATEVPRAVAIEAFELLRASLVEVRVAPSAPARAGPESPPTSPAVDRILGPARPIAREDEYFALDAGVGALSTATVLDGFGPSISVRMWLAPEWGFGVSTFGPTLATEARSNERAASITQFFALGQGYLAPFGSSQDLALQFTAGAGAHHIRAEGSDLPDDEQPVKRSSWSVALMPGAELRLRLTPALGVKLGAGALFLLASPRVHAASDELASIGRPALFVDAAAEVRW